MSQNMMIGVTLDKESWIALRGLLQFFCEEGFTEEWKEWSHVIIDVIQRAIDKAALPSEGAMHRTGCPRCGGKFQRIGSSEAAGIHYYKCEACGYDASTYWSKDDYIRAGLHSALEPWEYDPDD